jgi:hypothetical protein
MLKKVLLYLTPFSILAVTLAVMAIVGAVNKHLAGESKALLNVAEIVIIIPAVIIDVVLRLVFKNKIQWLWLVEAVLFLIFCFVFIKK